MRRKPSAKRVLSADPKYNNSIVSKLVNYVMWDGKKSIAREVIYDAFDIISKDTKKDPMDVFDEAIKNAAPMLEVKSRRIGGANYQVPRQVKGDRRITLALKWMVEAARAKKGQPMATKLASEIMAAAQNTGEAVKRKENTHRMAQANRAFAHFSW